ncbi:acyltransferase [Cronobacter dublinensis]
MARIFWIDCARFVAIIMVVFTHAHESARVTSEAAKSIFYSIDRIGVPIFFMLSGGLLLPKAHTIPILQFYKKRLPQFILLLFVYSVFTNTISGFLRTDNILDSFFNALKNYNGFFPASYGSATQMWFMYSIMQLYLIAPFVSRLVVTLKTQQIILFLGLCIAFAFVNRSISAMGVEWRFLSRLGGDFTGAYLAYFLTGYLIIDRDVLSNKIMKSKILSAFAILLPMVVVFFIDKYNGKIVDGLHWYSSSLFIYISSVGAIALVKVTCEQKQCAFITMVGSYSFGVYLIHYVFILIFSLLLRQYDTNWIVSTVLTFLMAFFLSLCYTHVMFKTKFTKYLTS